MYNGLRKNNKIKNYLFAVWGVSVEINAERALKPTSEKRTSEQGPENIH